jgi:uncharacterized protein (UPF0264 family)
MQLLVSVLDAEEAFDALSGGADVIDAKNPHAGPLGAVSLDVFHAIRSAVGGRRVISAALDEATDELVVEQRAAAFVEAGASFVKVGVGRTSGAERMAALAAAAVRGAESARHGQHAGRKQNPAERLGPSSRRGGSPAQLIDSEKIAGVVLVGYADVTPLSATGAGLLIETASRAGAAGVLLDTENKQGPGLRSLVDEAALARWIAIAHASRLFVAVAGRLTADDLAFARDAGADIAGVRGAACTGGRTGRITAENVRRLQSTFARITPPPAPSAQFA